MAQQGVRLGVLEAASAARLGYNGAWHDRFTIAGIPPGDFNGRLLSWINLRYTQTFTNLPGAMAYMASVNGATNFSSMGSFVAV